MDTIKILAQAQEYFSSTDVSDFFKDHHGSPEPAAFMLSLDSVRYELSCTGHEDRIYPALARALHEYGRAQYESDVHGDLAGWESIIRRLIRIGVDIHAPIPCIDDQYALSRHRTPLDGLFTRATTPGQAKSTADAWLHILSTEGYDVRSYLEYEEAFHAMQWSLYEPEPYSYGPILQLIFDFSESPSVFVDWWIDPESSTFLVRQAFKDMNTFRDPSCLTWKNLWPFDYPIWFLEYGIQYIFEDVELKTNQQLSRRRRWQKKAAKAARLNRSQANCTMPGAWPAG